MELCKGRTTKFSLKHTISIKDLRELLDEYEEDLPVIFTTMDDEFGILPQVRVQNIEAISTLSLYSIEFSL